MIKLNQDEWNELEQCLGHDPNIDGERECIVNEALKEIECKVQELHLSAKYR